MVRSRLRVSLFSLWIVMTVPAFAQTSTNTTGVGHDYFTADQDGVADYLRLLTGAHVNTIPKWLEQGRIGNAVADLRYSLDRFPNHPLALQYMGMVAGLAKNKALAVSYFEKAVTEFPQYALTQAQYGVFLVSIGDVDGGIERLNQAVAKDPKFAAGYAGLAQAYVKKGDVTKARESAAKARELGFTGQLPPGL